MTALLYGSCTGPFGFPMREQSAKNLDLILKSLPKEPAYAYQKAVIAGGVTENNPGERSDVSWISTEAVDRQGHVVRAKGLNDSQFQANPLVTLGHAYDLPPVGKSLWRKFAKDGEQRGIKAKTKYPERPTGWPENDPWPPDKVFALVQAGLLSGKSIGFLPTKVHAPTPQEIEQNGWKGAQLAIDEWLLVEYACVFIPANQATLVEAVSKGMHIPEPLLKAMGLDPAQIALSKSQVATVKQREEARFKLRDADGTIKYPINDCADVADAWKLRGHATNIPQDRVEAYIRRVARTLGCNGPWNDGKALLPESPSGEWPAVEQHFAFTTIEDINKAIQNKITALNLDNLIQDALDRARGRV